MKTDIWNEFVEMYDSDLDLRVKYTFYYNMLHRLCTEMVRDLAADYNDFFSQLQAVCRLTNYQLYDVDRFRWRARKVMLGDEIADKKIYYLDMHSLADALAHFTDTPIPEALKLDIIQHQDADDKEDGKLFQKNKKKKWYKSARFVFQSKDDEYVYALSRQLPRKTGCWKIDFHRSQQTEDAATQLIEGMQMNAISFAVDDEQTIIAPEMIVLEPDYLIDVSSLCSCLKYYGSSPLNYLIDCLRPDEMTKYIVLGNIAGQFLDDCVNHPDITYLESMQRAFQTSMLDISTCDGIDAVFFDECKKQFYNIQKTVAQLYNDPHLIGEEGNVQLEPSFFCEVLGIQGRFDFLQCDNKTLIEMKSGQWDKYHQTAKREHLMQMILYKEIMYHNLNAPQLSVRGYLLYSKYPILLEQRTAREMVFQMMQIRNRIILMLRNIRTKGIEQYLNRLSVDDLNEQGVNNRLWVEYTKPELEKLLQPLQSMDPLTAEYFNIFSSFILREQYLGRVGDKRQESTRGMASLWNADLDTKMENGDIMIDLALIPISTKVGEPITTIVLEKSRLGSKRQTASAVSPNFRTGDPVVVYQRNHSSDTAVSCQVVRCCVENYDDETITLQLNHPQTNPHIFNPNSRYAIEHDYMDGSSRQQLRGLYSFLTVNKKRRDLLLGVERPKSDCGQRLQTHYQSHLIDDVVLRAKQAQDYFLLVGPPGTGKTSIALKSMVRDFLAERQSLVLLAFTNRAVDEICETLEDLPYIRIGRELTCDPKYRSHLLPEMMDDKINREVVRNLFLNTPIVVGTVNSITSSKSLFKLRQYDVAIIDEASQILEPQLMGLLCDERNGQNSIGKFVMIGDQKQLPAVVVQEKKQSEVASELLHEIGLTDCANSLFERLLHLAVMRGDDHVVATLNMQGRMHPEIASFANKAFYGGGLGYVGLAHQKESLAFVHYKEGEQFVATCRLGFVDVPLPPLSERQPKVNMGEASVIAQLVVQLVKLSKENAVELDLVSQIGIIVPFRRQIVAVRQALCTAGVLGAEQMMIDTVERYQGSQKDVIIYGTTISRPFELEMLSVVVDCDGCLVDRKLNVAITRARKQLFVVGNKKLLEQNTLYRQLIEFAQKPENGFLKHSS